MEGEEVTPDRNGRTGIQKYIRNPSDPDHAPYIPKSESGDYIYVPILEESVAAVVFGLLSKAKGLDGASLEEIKKSPLVDTTLLFNIMVYIGYIPKILRQCRTTLISKTGADLKDVGGWHPITISSLIYRIFTKILAGRFHGLDFHASQKGFLTIDGTPAHNITLHTLIKECRAKARPYTLIALNI